VRLSIIGRVQGVWFRGSAREEARRLGIRGFARNCADGSVEVLAEGGAAQVQLFVEWCKHGPPGARVSRVTRDEETPGDELIDFRVL
jgi:acylphosphatase